jgi:hypothetical protein
MVSKHARKLLAIVAAVAAVLSVGLVAPAAEAATGPSMRTGGGVRACVARDGGTSESFPYKPGCLPIASLSEGTPVQMICYGDAAWDTGEYRSNRWFYIRAGTVKGFVHSSRVDPQVTVKPCSTNRGVSASRWAAEHVGFTDPTATERTAVGIPVGDYWSGWCAGFARLAYEFGAKIVPKYANSPSAKAWYLAYKDAGLTKKYSASLPVGSLVFWEKLDGDGGFGHAAVYVGNGMVVSTDGGDGQRLPNHRVDPVARYGTPSGAVVPTKV